MESIRSSDRFTLFRISLVTTVVGAGREYFTEVAPREICV